VFDSSWLCGLNEELSFVTLAERTMQLRHVVIGFYKLPASSEEPLGLSANPDGAEARLQKRVRNWGARRAGN
jgi:hypothetical protein